MVWNTNDWTGNRTGTYGSTVRITFGEHNRGDSSHCTEDKPYTTQSTTGRGAGQAGRRMLGNRVVADKFADFFEEVAEKLRENPDEWMGILLRMKRNIGKFLDELARKGWE